MASLLSNLGKNLAKGIHKINCKFRHVAEKCETCGIKYKYCECCLQCLSFRHDLIKYRCLCCNKSYQKCLMKT